MTENKHLQNEPVKGSPILLRNFKKNKETFKKTKNYLEHNENLKRNFKNEIENDLHLKRFKGFNCDSCIKLCVECNEVELSDKRNNYCNDCKNLRHCNKKKCVECNKVELSDKPY